MTGYQQLNRLFRVDQQGFYKDINGDCTIEKLIPDNKKCQMFWSDT